MKVLTTIILILLSVSSFSQEESYSANIILIIDNELVTSPLKMSFTNENDTINFNYQIGNKLEIKNIFFIEDDVNLSFRYSGKSIDNFTNYKYNFKFLKGWLVDTNYLIVRIYNLDKKKYRKAFCKEKSQYVVEVQNQVYSQNQAMCRKLVLE